MATELRVKSPKLSKGKAYPLGSTVTPDGVNFSLFSQNATMVELCLFDRAEDTVPSHTIEIPFTDDHIWHCHLEGIQAGQLYAYRVHGEFKPEVGARFNPNKLLLDPYAKSIGRELKWDDSLFGYTVGHEAQDLSFDDRDSAAFAPLSRVADTRFDWQETTKPQRGWPELIIYETHVKGMTIQHPDVPDELKGTYLGMATPAIIDYLKSLGVTAVELLPVQHFINDRFLVDRDLANYWGYNTLGFYAPEPKYVCKSSPLSDIDQFKTMVKTLHDNDIEVIMDVAYNHSGEGNQCGPTLTFRGIDNQCYYRMADDPRYYFDTTGCGNTFNVNHPAVLRLLMDSLRYWATEMQIDGFRFDLASTLGRERDYFDQFSSFFKVISQDPVLSQVKLIAEPWDIGGDGFQVGNFPVGWSEWNGRYRDTIRSFWKGDEGTLSVFADGFTGSSLLYGHDARKLYATVNYVTCHDGFTLKDLVSYNDKHNEANGDNNNDGDSHNSSWNCGHEGETDNPEVIALRQQQMRNMTASVLLSFGVPMLNGGDELARSQQGNNNGYCQDSPISWYNWDEKNPESQAQLEFVKKLIQLRQKNGVFRRETFFEGEVSLDTKKTSYDIYWFNPNGETVEDDHWANPAHKTFGLVINDKMALMTDEGAGDGSEMPKFAKSVIILVNAYHDSIDYDLSHLDASLTQKSWRLVFDTSQPETCKLDVMGVPRETLKLSNYVINSRSMVVLEATK